MADGKRPDPATVPGPGRQPGQASPSPPGLGNGPFGPGAAKAADVGQMSFEDALAELEQIVRGLEGGQQKLEDAIGAYERGAALRRHCEAKLAEAEARVAAIVEHADGSLGTRPVD
jgi:exodeoxyribonuclease VII small subunit